LFQRSNLKQVVRKWAKIAHIQILYFIAYKYTAEGRLMAKESELTVFTIGHSTRTLDEFIGLLKAYEVGLVVDVRTVPRSRHNPQFNKETLPASLKSSGIRYIHMPEIGGLRRPKHDSINLAWKSLGFRGYADYMQTKEFTDNLLKIVALARESCLALMCAEALPWRCHRSLISDALIVRHAKVLHIISKDNTINHELTEFAQVEGTKITYPLFTKETPQRTLGDFGAEA
jgi:uncharacterized protein (DUF488 family)